MKSIVVPAVTLNVPTALPVEEVIVFILLPTIKDAPPPPGPPPPPCPPGALAIYHGPCPPPEEEASIPPTTTIVPPFKVTLPSVSKDHAPPLAGPRTTTIPPV